VRYTDRVTLEGFASNRIDEETLQYLRVRGSELRFAEGETIVCQGDPGEALWVITEGAVELQLRSADGTAHPVARFGPHETFGELAILRAAPSPSDVVALTPVSVLRYPAEHLPAALAECEPLRRSLLSRLAHSAYRSASKAWSLFRRTQSLSNLYQGTPQAESMVAVSARMRAVKTRIEEAAASRVPVLISGEPGTGKLLAARLIHAASARRPAALISVDCCELTGRDADSLLFGAAETGSEEVSDPLGAIHLAHGGTLVLRNVEALAPDTQLELARHLAVDQDTEQVPYPDVRLIVTTGGIGDSTGSPDLEQELRQRLPITIDLPPLAERPRDIVPLARSFLADDIEGSTPLVLTSSAEQALVSLKYRHRNVDELRSIIELAASCADQGEIRAEHIFSGFAGERPAGLDLSRFWLVRWLVHGGGLGLVRLATAAGFLGVAGLCLVAGGSQLGRLANGLVWSVWEPVVFALFLLVGSLWCTVCPLSTSGRLARRLYARERPPPDGVLRAGGWLSAAGFVLILWSEKIFGMLTTPVASGLLLLALVAAAVTCSVLWQREVWCRYLCPLGRLGVALAPVAPMAVAARRSICASTCTTHDCYKGSSNEPGCPVFHHPQLVSEGHHCKMCLTCLRSCPHGATGLYLRPRLRSAWRLTGSESYVVPLALTLLLLAPVLVAAHGSGRLS
jgi:CRP-like cAMP-binding protein